MQVNYSENDIEKSITSQDVKSIQLVYFSMFLGVLFMLLAVFFISKVYHADPAPIANHKILYIVLVLLTLVCYALFLNFDSLFLKMKKMQKLLNKKDAASDPYFLIEKMIAKMILILRVAILESAALISCIALFVAARQGILIQNKLLWFFALPSLLFFVYIFTSFPSANSIVLLIKKKIQRNLD